MNAKCTNRSNFRLTEEKDYTVVKSERNYIFVENDGGVLARYDRKYFEIEEVEPRRSVAPVVPPPPPPRTVADVIASIVITTENVTFIDINLENKSFTLPFGYSDTMISCGVGQVNGINSLCSRINNQFNREEGDFLEEKIAIFRLCIQTWILDKTTKAIWTLSTAIDQIDGDYIRILDEMSGTRSETVHNPNSGNQIKVWFFYPIIEINEEDDDDRDYEDDDENWDDED